MHVKKRQQDSENTSWEGSIEASLWIFFHIWKIAKFLDDKIKSAKSFICKEILLRVTRPFYLLPSQFYCDIFFSKLSDLSVTGLFYLCPRNHFPLTYLQGKI